MKCKYIIIGVIFLTLVITGVLLFNNSYKEEYIGSYELLSETGYGIFERAIFGEESFYIQTGNASWNFIKATENESGLILWTANAKDKKTEIGFIPPNNDCTGQPDKFLYNQTGKILDDKDKNITLKCESSKCDGQNCYHISLTDAQAINVGEYLKLGETSAVVSYQNQTSIHYDAGFAQFIATIKKNISGNYDNNVNDLFITYYPERTKFGGNDTSNTGLEHYKYELVADVPLYNEDYNVYFKDPIPKFTSIGQYYEGHNFDFSDICLNESAQCEFIYNENFNNETNLTNYLYEIYFYSGWFIDPVFTITDLNTSGVTSNVTIEGAGLFGHLTINEKSIVAYYPFDVKDDSTKVYDWSENHVDGTLTGAVWNETGGMIGGAYMFDGVNDNINLGSPDSLNLNESFTIMAWIYSDNFKGTSSYNLIYIDGTNRLTFGIEDSSGVLESWTNNAGSDVGGTVLTDSVWHHAVVTFNGTDKIFYLDGSVDGTPQAAPKMTGHANVYLGAFNTIWEFNGTIDELIVFNDSLNSSQVLDIYNNQSSRFYIQGSHALSYVNVNDRTDNIINVTTNNLYQLKSNNSLMLEVINSSVNMSGLVSYYNFDRGKAWDLNNGTNDGAITGATWNATGGNGSTTGAYEFDGVGDEIEIGTGSDYSDLCVNGCTFTAWVKPAEIDVGKRIIARTDSTGDNRFFDIFQTTTERITFTIYENGNATSCADSSPSSSPLLSATNWSFITAVYNLTDIIICLDGVCDTASCAITINETAWEDSEDTFIGTYDDSSTRPSFNGTIDNVMIWKRGLSEVEILQLYNNQTSQYDLPYFTSEQSVNEGNNVNSFNINSAVGFVSPFYKYNSVGFGSPILFNSTVFYNNDSGGAPSDNPPTITNSLPVNATYINITDTVAHHCNATDDINLYKIGVQVFNASLFELVDAASIVSGLENSTIKTTDEYSLNGTYFWRCYAEDNNSQTTYADYVTLFVVNNSTAPSDDEFPLFSNFLENPSDPATYSAGITYRFNTTVINTNGTVLIEFNGTNSTTTNSSNNFSFDIVDLAVGNYTYYWWAFGNGTSTNYNLTQTFSYNITQSLDDCAIVFNETSPLNYTDKFKVGSNCTSDFRLLRNGTLIANNSEQSLGAGTYNFTVYRNDTFNYSIITDEETFTINQIASQTSLIFNESTPISFGTQVNVSCSVISGEGSVTLYRDGIDVTIAENSQSMNLGAGTYSYECNLSATQNYTASTNSSSFVVNQIASEVNLTLNSTEGNITITQLNSILLNGTLITGDIGSYLELFNNLTSINNATTEVSNTTTYSNVGVFNVTIIYAGSQNYTASSETYWVNVTAAADIEYPQFSNFIESPLDHGNYSSGATYRFNATIIRTNGTAGIEFNGVNSTATNNSNNFTTTQTDLAAGTYNYTWWAYGNGSEGLYNLTQQFNYTINKAIAQTSLVFNETTPINFGTQLNASCSILSGVGSVVLYRDGVDVTATENGLSAALGAGTYNYECNLTESQNYTAATNISTFIVNQIASEVNLTLNSTEGNITITNGTSILLNGTLITGDLAATLQLYNDGIIINSGTTEVSNTTLFPTPGFFNITVIYISSENYTISSETYWVNVTGVPDTTPPTFNNLRNFTQAANQSFSESITANDTSGIDSYVLNDTSIFNVNKTTGLIFNVTALDNIAFYLLNLSVNDTAGNENSGIFYINITSIPVVNPNRIMEIWENRVDNINITIARANGNWTTIGYWNGLYAWVVSSSYANFNGSQLTIDDVLLNTNFNQTNLMNSVNDSINRTFNEEYTNNTYLRLDSSNSPLQGNLNMGQFNLTNIAQLRAIDGSAIRFGANGNFTGFDQAIVIQSNQTLGPGIITHALLDNQGGKVIEAWQSGKNNSAGFHRNSYLIFGDLGITNASILTNARQMWLSFGITPFMDYDTATQGASLGVQYGIETQKIFIHNDLGIGQFLMDGGDFRVISDGKDIDLYEGDVHIQDSEIRPVGEETGANITVVTAPFTSGLTPFVLLTTGKGIDEWATTPNGNCPTGSGALCSHAGPSGGSGDTIMQVNFTSNNVQLNNLSFNINTDSMSSGGDFNVTINNNTGSGDVEVYSLVGADVSDVVINVSIPAEMDNGSVISMNFIFSSTHPNRGDIWVDNILISGTVLASTVINQTFLDGKIEFGDGSCKIEVDGDGNHVTIGGVGCGNINFTRNTTFTNLKTIGEVQIIDTNTGSNAGSDLCIDTNNRICACGSCA
ncbi:MAG: LamG-like jellyroll fold domain-containing protein [Candidatus Heimdallarchaeaceae archaeon]